jgi:hypothetical protein
MMSLILNDMGFRNELRDLNGNWKADGSLGPSWGIDQRLEGNARWRNAAEHTLGWIDVH